MKITEDCINCCSCVSECQNNAIFESGDTYIDKNGNSQSALSDEHTYIVPELCENCRNCVDVCPVEAIVE